MVDCQTDLEGLKKDKYMYHVMMKIVEMFHLPKCKDIKEARASIVAKIIAEPELRPKIEEMTSQALKEVEISFLQDNESDFANQSLVEEIKLDKKDYASLRYAKKGCKTPRE